MECAIQFKGVLILSQIHNHLFPVPINGKRAAVYRSHDGINRQWFDLRATVLRLLAGKLEGVILAGVGRKTADAGNQAIPILAQLNGRRTGGLGDMTTAVPDAAGTEDGQQTQDVCRFHGVAG